MVERLIQADPTTREFWQEQFRAHIQPKLSVEHIRKESQTLASYYSDYQDGEEGAMACAQIWRLFHAICNTANACGPAFTQENWGQYIHTYAEWFNLDGGEAVKISLFNLYVLVSEQIESLPPGARGFQRTLREFTEEVELHVKHEDKTSTVEQLAKCFYWLPLRAPLETFCPQNLSHIIKGVDEQ